MPDAYTLFCPRERVDVLRRLHWQGKQLEVLFGGPHISLPSFIRAGVHPGDVLYPITVRSGVLYVLGRTRVRRLLDMETYINEHPDLFASPIEEAKAWAAEHSAYRYDPDAVFAHKVFERYRSAHPEVEALSTNYADEVVECEESTPLQFDRAVPPDLLATLRFRSHRSERDLHKHLRNGRLVQSLGVQGIYRLTESSARALEALVRTVPDSL